MIDSLDTTCHKPGRRVKVNPRVERGKENVFYVSDPQQPSVHLVISCSTAQMIIYLLIDIKTIVFHSGNMFIKILFTGSMFNSNSTE